MINPTELFDTITRDYDDLITAELFAQACEEDVLTCKIALEQRRQSILVEYAEDAKALGSNEATRKATVDTMCAAEIDALAKAEGDARAAKNLVAIRRLYVERDRAQLRIAELAAGITREGK